MIKNHQITQITSQLLLSQLVSFCMRRGWSSHEVFRKAGYDLALLRIGQRLLTQDDLAPLIESIAQQKSMPEVALQLGQEIHSEQLGLFGALISSSTNLTVAVQRFSEFNQLLNDHFRLELELVDGALWLVYDSAHLAHAIPASYSELLFSAVATHSNQFSRLNAEPLCIEFAHPKPDYAELYASYFACPIRFDQPLNRMQLPVHAANAPFATQNTRYHQHALTEAKKLVPQQNGLRSKRVSTYLRMHLADAEACQLEAMCKHLNCSSRTLQRELNAENTSLKQLLDDERHALACHLLQSTTASVESIGQSVGFKHASSFAAKFKSWTGMTPRQYRQSFA